MSAKQDLTTRYRSLIGRTVLARKDSAMLTRGQVLAGLRASCSLVRAVLVICAVVLAVIAVVQIRMAHDIATDPASESQLYDITRGALSFLVLGQGDSREIFEPSGGFARLYLFTNDDGQTLAQVLIANIVFCAIMVEAIVSALRFIGRLAASGRPFEFARADELVSIAEDVALAAIMPGLAAGSASYIGFLAHWTSSWNCSLVQIELLAFAAILLFIANVFRYGCLLQQTEDDLV